MLTENSGKDLSENMVFCDDIQRLDGFDIGFMEPSLFKHLCKKHGLDPETSEAIMMQTENMTEPHVHMRGESVFLPLGEAEGYAKSRGGTYLGSYFADDKNFELDYVPAQSLEPFQIAPGMIHFFAPEKGAKFTAIAFVNPKIKSNDGNFDIMRFEQPKILKDKEKAEVSLG